MGNWEKTGEKTLVGTTGRKKRAAPKCIFNNARVTSSPVLFLCARNAGILPAVFTTLIPAIRSYHCNFPNPTAAAGPATNLPRRGRHYKSQIIPIWNIPETNISWLAWISKRQSIATSTKPLFRTSKKRDSNKG